MYIDNSKSPPLWNISLVCCFIYY